jgi:DNA-binding CsgD family transcriptional regulator
MDEAPVDRLSTRHRECLRLYGRRYKVKEIARELGISDNTVNGYLTEAARLLNVGRTEAAALLLAREAAHPDSRGRFSAGDEPAPIPPIPSPQRAPAEPISVWSAIFPLRPMGGQSNTLPWQTRLLAIVIQLILLILLVAVAVAMYTIYVKPLGRLFS